MGCGAVLLVVVLSLCHTARHALATPVFMMMPLDTVNNDGTLKDPSGLQQSLHKIKEADVDGVMLDVWWGIVEREGPMTYDWGAYEQFVQYAQDAKLQVQAVMSFHQCGGNVGDACSIPLPQWVLDCGNNDPNIFYTDAESTHNKEYLSLGVDSVEVLQGRTPVTVYADFMQSFARTFADYLTTTIVEVQVGLGPAGELRYPSYPSDRWTFPGIGEFQCYDKYLLADLKQTATNAGHSDWGNAGPDNAGTYNNKPWDTGFFTEQGSWGSDYGKFFLSWYSKSLIGHGDRVLGAARGVFSGQYYLPLAAKIAGIHWWYKYASHAAELTAGYYNVYGEDGYSTIAAMFAAHNVTFDFTMLEMTDNDNPDSLSGPEELVAQTFAASINAKIGYAGENALPRYDQAAYDRIVTASRFNGHTLDAFTYLRWDDTVQQQQNWSTFQAFVNTMHNLNDALLRQKLQPSHRAALVPHAH